MSKQRNSPPPARIPWKSNPEIVTMSIPAMEAFTPFEERDPKRGRIAHRGRSDGC